MVRAPVLQTGGRGFESLRAHTGRLNHGVAVIVSAGADAVVVSGVAVGDGVGINSALVAVVLAGASRFQTSLPFFFVCGAGTHVH